MPPLLNTGYPEYWQHPVTFMSAPGGARRLIQIAGLEGIVRLLKTTEDSFRRPYLNPFALYSHQFFLITHCSLCCA